MRNIKTQYVRYWVHPFLNVKKEDKMPSKHLCPQCGADQSVLTEMLSDSDHSSESYLTASVIVFNCSHCSRCQGLQKGGDDAISDYGAEG